MGLGGCKDFGSLRHGDARGPGDVLEDYINKQHIDFCAEFVKCNFRWLSEK